MAIAPNLVSAMRIYHETSMRPVQARDEASAVSAKRLFQHPERMLGVVLWLGLLAVLVTLSAQQG